MKLTFFGLVFAFFKNNLFCHIKHEKQNFRKWQLFEKNSTLCFRNGWSAFKIVIIINCFKYSLTFFKLFCLNNRIRRTQTGRSSIDKLCLFLDVFLSKYNKTLVAKANLVYVNKLLKPLKWINYFVKFLSSFVRMFSLVTTITMRKNGRAMFSNILVSWSLWRNCRFHTVPFYKSPGLTSIHRKGLSYNSIQQKS